MHSWLLFPQSVKLTIGKLQKYKSIFAAYKKNNRKKSDNDDKGPRKLVYMN